MQLSDAIEKIRKYLNSEATSPMIVDVQSRCDEDAIRSQFTVGNYKVISVSLCCHEDEMAQIDNLYQIMHEVEAPTFIINLSPFLFLEGEQVLSQTMRTIIGMQINAPIVVITYICSKYLDFKDKRIQSTSRVVIVDGEKDTLPKVVITASNFCIPADAVVLKGLQSISELGRADSEQVFLLTSKHPEQYPYTMLSLSEIASAYDALEYKDIETRSLPKEYGTDSEWEYALALMEDSGVKSLRDLAVNQFGSLDVMDLQIQNYPSFLSNKKWLLFISMKLFGTGTNKYLAAVVNEMKQSDELISGIYRRILSYAIKNSNFTELYQERRRLLSYVSESNIAEATSFSQVVHYKGKEAIYYLTDITAPERRVIFELLDKYGTEYEPSELTNILKTVYPDLAKYLATYRFKDDFMTKYFSQYKYQKVINKVLPEFLETVNEQAVKRDYLRLLLPRTRFAERINKKDTILYFVDAMGVEYLSYVLAKCAEHNLMADTTVCMAELPSITYYNKEFIEVFENAGCRVLPIDILDKGKHHGTQEFDYEKTKLPTYLITELNEIAKIITDIDSKIARGECKRAVIIADHGASRLCVLNQHENQYEMESKGEHSGRCCPMGEIVGRPDCATEENEFWVLANYDRFVGGRRSNVEVHGGASLEEITVPIIEISRKAGDIEVFIIDDYKTIAVSFRKKALIRIYVGAKLNNLVIRIGDTYYDAVPTDTEFVYEITMLDIKKPKTYTFDVLNDNSVLAAGLSFTVKKEGSSENDLF